MVLSDRRKVYPTQSLPCTVPGYELNFNCPGVPYFEPSFASINRITEPSQQNTSIEVHGVVHRITQREMWAIRLSEGGNGHEGLGYDLLEVEVVTYSGKKVQAVTLIYPEVEGWCAHPSRRYMNLILEGALANGLRPSYLAYLQSLPIYERKTCSQAIATCLSGILTLTFLLPVFSLLACYRLWWTNKRPPRLSIIVFNAALATLHLIHNLVLCPLLGSGFQSPHKTL
jgi:hypothetical protein